MCASCVTCITIGIQRIYRKTLAHTSLRVLMRIRSACYNNVSVQLYNIYLDLSVFLHSGKIIIRISEPASQQQFQKDLFIFSPKILFLFSHTHTQLCVCRTAPICILHYATYTAILSLRPQQPTTISDNNNSVPTGWDVLQNKPASSIFFFFFPAAAVKARGPRQLLICNFSFFI